MTKPRKFTPQRRYAIKQCVLELRRHSGIEDAKLNEMALRYGMTPEELRTAIGKGKEKPFIDADFVCDGDNEEFDEESED